MGVAAVPRLGGGDTELFSACFCSVKFWLVFTSLPASSKCYPLNVGKRLSSDYFSSPVPDEARVLPRPATAPGSW